MLAFKIIVNAGIRSLYIWLAFVAGDAVLRSE